MLCVGREVVVQYFVAAIIVLLECLGLHSFEGSHMTQQKAVGVN